jgi:hypothetical protein
MHIRKERGRHHFMENAQFVYAQLGFRHDGTPKGTFALPGYLAPGPPIHPDQATFDNLQYVNFPTHCFQQLN